VSYLFTSTSRRQNDSLWSCLLLALYSPLFTLLSRNRQLQMSDLWWISSQKWFEEVILFKIIINTYHMKKCLWKYFNYFIYLLVWLRLHASYLIWAKQSIYVWCDVKRILCLQRPWNLLFDPQQRFCLFRRMLIIKYIRNFLSQMWMM